MPAAAGYTVGGTGAPPADTFKEWAAGVWATKQIGVYGSTGTPSEPETKVLSATISGTNVPSTTITNAFVTAMAYPWTTGYSVRVPWTSIDAGNGHLNPAHLDTLRALYPSRKLQVRFMAGRYTPKVYKGRTWHEDTFDTTQTGATLTIATDLITKTGHGLAAGDIVQFSSIVTTTGLSPATNYWVIGDGLTTTTFKVSASYGGSAVNLAAANGTASFARAQSAPCPFLEDGTPGNPTFTAAYGTLVTELAQWCRDNGVRLMHLSTYGAKWDEIANHNELQAMQGYTQQGFIDAHNELLDLCVPLVGDDLAVEWPTSGFNVTTVNGPILAHALAVFPALTFAHQQNGWCGPYGTLGRPNQSLLFGAQSWMTSQTQNVAGAGKTWAAGWPELNTTHALYAEIYLESFIEQITSANPLDTYLTANPWTPTPTP